MHTPSVGIDFGTTNSSIARMLPDGGVELAQFDTSSGLTQAYRSLLYLELVEEGRAKRVKSWTGPAGIEQYLAAETKGRLIQSLKSFLSARSLRSTEVFGRRMRLEELIARILRDLRESVSRQFQCDLRQAVVGRPVRFVGAETEEDNTFAEQRLRESLLLAGFETVAFELEPVAAAHYYESRLDHDELILIGDFGGGTSDFSLLHVGPGVLRRGRKAADFLGNSGLGLAGDAFDAKLVRHLVSPELGRGSEAESLGKVLPAVPNWVYAKLERWHHLSFLRTSAVTTMLRSTLASAYEPNKIQALIHLVNEDLGYHLHRSVQQVKCDLSARSEATFRFADGGIKIEALVRRTEFEEWIAEELGQIEACVDALVAGAGVHRRDVDMVFLTGGSSFVPAVRRIFETRFGTRKIRAGDEFTSVAQGLAHKARQS